MINNTLFGIWLKSIYKTSLIYYSLYKHFLKFFLQWLITKWILIISIIQKKKEGKKRNILHMKLTFITSYYQQLPLSSISIKKNSVINILHKKRGENLATWNTHKLAIKREVSEEVLGNGKMCYYTAEVSTCTVLRVSLTDFCDLHGLTGVRCNPYGYLWFLQIHLLSCSRSIAGVIANWQQFEYKEWNDCKLCFVCLLYIWVCYSGILYQNCVLQWCWQFVRIFLQIVRIFCHDLTDR